MGSAVCRLARRRFTRVFVVAGAVWTVRRRRHWIQRMGLLCGGCGQPLVDRDGTLLLRSGSCPKCGTPVAGGRPSGMSARIREELAHSPSSQEEEFRGRLEAYHRQTTRDGLAFGAICLLSFLAGSRVSDMWPNPGDSSRPSTFATSEVVARIEMNPTRGPVVLDRTGSWERGSVGE